MTITPEHIHHIAQLARLSVSENIDSLAADLSRIIDLVDQLSHVNTDSIEPLFNSHDAHQILRPDIVEIDDR
ncbi:MAG: Asp-tRNA(Asn)/Glu-tRNA(Gln) amidotransferase subunit GatC, partial [Pseudomonadota bacterium]